MKSLRPPYSQIGCMTRTDVRRFGGPSPVASAYSLSRAHTRSDARRVHDERGVVRPLATRPC